jgi:hypothetical protein
MCLIALPRPKQSEALNSPTPAQDQQLKQRIAIAPGTPPKKSEKQLSLFVETGR